jgi:hypothetical protein
MQARRLRFAANGLVISSSQEADVAELADALDSKSSTGNSVWVRSPPSADPLLEQKRLCNRNLRAKLRF